MKKTVLTFMAITQVVLVLHVSSAFASLIFDKSEWSNYVSLNIPPSYSLNSVTIANPINLSNLQLGFDYGIIPGGGVGGFEMM